MREGRVVVDWFILRIFGELGGVGDWDEGVFKWLFILIVVLEIVDCFSVNWIVFVIVDLVFWRIIVWRYFVFFGFFILFWKIK